MKVSQNHGQTDNQMLYSPLVHKTKGIKIWTGGPIGVSPGSHNPLHIDTKQFCSDQNYNEKN